MKLPRMVLRNLRRRPLATSLTTLSVALGVGLFASIGALRKATEQSFQRSASLCDTLVGPKGSPLQIVLNSLYHIGLSPGNITFSLYEELVEDPAVLWSVPLAVGDSLQGHRIVAVTDSLFKDVEIPGDYGKLRFSSGQGFEFDHSDLIDLHHELATEAGIDIGHDHAHDHAHEGEAHDDHGHSHGEHSELFVAVMGSEAARKTGLGAGQEFVPTHDVQGFGGEQHEEDPFHIVGVLEPTGTPIDRAIYIPVGAFYLIEGHKPTEESEFGGARDPLGLSAVLVRTNPKSGFAKIRLQRSLNNRLDAQAILPAAEVRNLFQVVGNVDQVLSIVAALVVVVALVGVLVAIYNTMGARRKEFAVLRALGARRATVFTLIVGESAAIALAGALVGFLLAVVGIILGAGRIEEELGIQIDVVPGAQEIVLLAVVTLVGAIAGFVPAFSAYRTEAARHLSSGT